MGRNREPHSASKPPYGFSTAAKSGGVIAGFYSIIYRRLCSSLLPSRQTYNLKAGSRSLSPATMCITLHLTQIVANKRHVLSIVLTLVLSAQANASSPHFAPHTPPITPTRPQHAHISLPTFTADPCPLSKVLSNSLSSQKLLLLDSIHCYLLLHDYES